MTTSTRLISGGHEIDPSTVAALRDSSGDVSDVAALRQRMDEEGYLYIPGLLNRDEVLAARREILERLARDGALAEDAELMDGVLRPGNTSAFRPDLTKGNRALERVVYDGPMMRFWHDFLGGDVRHFDYTWLRTVPPGTGTASHCDIVYMGRGTPRLYTAWTPLGDISYELGGLIVLEKSQRHEGLRKTYCQMDVDAVCTNRPKGTSKWSAGTGGWLSKNPNQIRASIGGRWVTGEYRAGDVIVFSVYTVHASLDNLTADRIRLSSDTRYQLASEPADERWIGENPIAHGPAGKRGKIC